MKKKRLLVMVFLILFGCICLTLYCFLPSHTNLIIENAVSVTVDGVSVSEEAISTLVELLRTHRKTHFPVGADDPGPQSRNIRIDCSDGNFYVLHVQYYSGLSLDPFHLPGKGASRSILTHFGQKRKAWKLDPVFQRELDAWLLAYAEGEVVTQAPTQK